MGLLRPSCDFLALCEVVVKRKRVRRSKGLQFVSCNEKVDEVSLSI